MRNKKDQHGAGDFFLAIDIRHSTLRPPRPLPRTVTVVSAQDLEYSYPAAGVIIGYIVNQQRQHMRRVAGRLPRAGDVRPRRSRFD